MVSPSDMLLFAAVVREGSFTAAARRLGITKQTASERLRNLEAELGVRLIERTTRRLRVTGAGADYFERCNAIAAQIEEANREVQQQQAEPVGRLRVSAPVLYGRRFLSPVVAEYLARYPRASIEVVLADRMVNLIEEGLDVAIRIGELHDSSLSAAKLGEGHVYVVASPQWLRRHGTPSVAELATARCVGVRSAEVWRIGDAAVRVQPVLVANDLEVLCDAAIAGVGVARLPGLVLREAVAQRELSVLFAEQPPLLRSVYAVFPSRDFLPARVRVFLDALRALVAPMQPLAATAAALPPRAPRRRSSSASRLRT